MTAGFWYNFNHRDRYQARLTALQAEPQRWKRQQKRLRRRLTLLDGWFSDHIHQLRATNAC